MTEASTDRRAVALAFRSNHPRAVDGSELPPVAELTEVLRESDGLTVGVRLRIALDVLEALG